MAKIDIVEWKPFISRLLKYAVLLFALMVTIKIVFDGFSYYLARRSIDAELEARKFSSLEYLLFLAQRERALVIASVETRCRERMQLAVYHVNNSRFASLPKEAAAAYKDAYDIKLELGAYIEQHGAKLVRAGAIREQVVSFDFEMAKLEETLKPLPGVTADNPDYVSFVAGAKAIAERYKALTERHGDLLKTVALSPALLDLSSIKVLEDRLKRLKAEREQNQEKVGKFEEILSKNAIWAEALAGGTNNPVLDEMAYDIQKDDKVRLRDVNCDALEAYYTAVMGRYVDLDSITGIDRSAGLGVLLRPVYALSQRYQELKLNYFSLPPVAQTLLVTLLLGGLGALTINVLRLSKVGWWNNQNDPLWGEIVLCPLLGAIAAFGIFLLGSTGLLLTSDVRTGSSGVTSLSAFFIGLLGFMSGLLYDEAFGRVRRFGSQLFSGDEQSAAAGSAEDRELARILRNAGASVAAELSQRFGIGQRVSKEKEFTLLLPSDDALADMTLAQWRKISEPASRPAFEAWLLRHHALKRVRTSDVAAGTSEIEADDGTKYALSLEDDVLTVGSAKAIKRDLEYGAGAIHILDRDPGIAAGQ